MNLTRVVRPFASLCLVLMAILATAQTASAAFQLRLEQGGFTPVTITDNGPGDLDPELGKISFNGPVGTFALNLTLGYSKPFYGNGTTQARLYLSTADVSTTVGGQLKVTLADTDFNFPFAPITMTSTVTANLLSAPAGSSVIEQVWADPLNASPLTAFPTVIPPGSFSPGMHGPFSSPGNYNNTINSAGFARIANGAYSLISQADILLAGPGRTIIDHMVVLNGAAECPGGQIGNFVWNDLNHNGIQDSGEPGIPDILVRLLDSDGVELWRQKTNLQGLYGFDGHCPATYTVVVNTPPGMVQTTSTVGFNSEVDSNGTPATVVIPPGNGRDFSIDFGFYLAPTTSCVAISAVQGIAITPVTLTGIGGAGGPYTFSATGLPAGLTMSSNGTISGTPTVSGNFNYSVTVTDSEGHTGTSNCSVNVKVPPTASCIAITAIQDVAITPVTMTGNGGVGGPYTFSATGLPAGLTMSSDGTISGTPTVSGNFNYTVTVTDSEGNTGRFNCSVTVNAPPTANCVAITAVQGFAITPVAMTGNGGAGGPYTFSATGLPAGLTMSSDGTISGTPTVSGNFNYTVIVTDSGGNTGTFHCSVTITVIHPATVLTTKSVSPGTSVNAQTTVTITVTERNSGDSTISNVFVTGTGCATWLPANVSILAVGATQDFSCVFTPTATTAWTATGHGTDVLNNPVPLTNETTSGTVTVNTSNVCSLSWGYWKNHVSAWPLTSLVLGSQTYSQAELKNLLALAVKGDASINLVHQLIAAKFNVLNGTNFATAGTNIVDADNLFSQFSGKLPYGVASSSAIGTQMTAVASNLDDFNSDGKLQPGCTNGSPSITLTLACGVNTGTVNVNYSYALPVSGGTGPFTFSITGGSLPPGLTLNASSGIISGIPTAAGTYSYSVSVVDSKGATASVSCGITITIPPPAPLSLACPANSAQIGVFYSSAFTATGGTAPFTFSIVSGSLPAGLVLDASTGTISGMPTSSGSFNYTGKVVDKNGANVSKSCTITVSSQSGGTNVCGLTWGYWKNHTNVWGASTLTLGGQSYAKSELQTILSAAVKGDASINLAHQLIAAKLNVLNGTRISTAGSNIADADALLAQFGGKLPYNVAVSSATGQAMTAVASNLDDFNSDGKLQPGCGGTAN